MTASIRRHFWKRWQKPQEKEQGKEANINEDEIEFGDVNRGLLGIGKMEMKPEDVAKVQNAARSKMEEKLEQQKVIEEADRFAKLSVWEIYQPMINAVTTGYSLQVEME